MDIHKVTIQLRGPRGRDAGRVETGYYTVADNTVTLVEQNGVPLDRYKLMRKIPHGADARVVAGNLLREKYSGVSGGDFNRPLFYPRLGKI